MRNAVESWNRACGSALLVALVLAFVPACGDDDEQDGDEGGGGESCAAEGLTDNQCTCSENQPMGYRQCTDDLVWTDCTCGPAVSNDECRVVGEPVQCHPCPGETEGRRTVCLQGGTFDCSCEDRGRDGG